MLTVLKEQTENSASQLDTRAVARYNQIPKGRHQQGDPAEPQSSTTVVREGAGAGREGKGPKNPRKEGRPTNREGRTHEKTKRTTQGSTTPNKHKQQAKQRAHGVQSERNTYTHRGAIDPAKSKKGGTSQGKLCTEGTRQAKTLCKRPANPMGGGDTQKREHRQKQGEKRRGKGWVATLFGARYYHFFSLQSPLGFRQVDPHALLACNMFHQLMHWNSSILLSRWAAKAVLK